MFDTQKIRNDFPVTTLKFPVIGSEKERNLIYMDHGASTHAPLPVIEKYQKFLNGYYANVHRGHHHLSIVSTELFDHVSEIILDFIKGDPAENCIMYTQNTTMALDMAGHMVEQLSGITLTTLMEHHSNDLPHRARGKVVHVDVLDEDGTLDYGDLERKLKNYHVKLVAVTGCSNVTGYFPDIHKIARLAHEYGAYILVDAAQLLAHASIDVKPNDHPEHIDFLAAAGHKAYAPMGSGFLFGPRKLFDSAQPYMPGGGTVKYVTEEDVFFDKSPDRHQGGTPNIAGAIAVGAAINYLSEIGMENVREHERELTDFTIQKLLKIPGLTLYGPKSADKKSGVLTFTLDGVYHELAATILNYEYAVATRNGCFCAHPLLHRLLKVSPEESAILRNKLVKGENAAIPGAIRATIGLYNTREEIEILIEALSVISAKKWKGNYEEKHDTDLCRTSYYEFKI